MDINLNSQNIRYLNCTYRIRNLHEETMEIIVPDTLPDILQIVDTDAVVLLRGKDAENGRVTVSGMICASVLYIPEGDGGVRKLDADIPFAFSADSGNISPADRLVAALSLVSADTRMINTRKVTVRADVLVDAACYADAEANFTEAVSCQAGMEIETLTAKKEMIVTAGVKEKTFLISEDLRLPANKPPVAEILKSSFQISAEETKAVGSKLVLKGTAALSILYRSHRSVTVETADFTIAYSQILEIDLEDVSDFDVQVALTGKYIGVTTPADTEDDVFTVELQAVAQCTAFKNVAIRYVSDVYSTNYALDCTLQQVELPVKTDCGDIVETIHGTVNCMTGVKRVVQTRVQTGIVTATPTEVGTEIRTTAFVSILYIAEDGALSAAAQRLDVETRTEELCTGAVCLPVTEVYVTVSSTGFELRFPLTFHMESCSGDTFTTICAVACPGDVPMDIISKPSIVIYRVQPGDTLWILAKRYHSTPALIAAANGLEDENNIQIGQQLLIPKKR